MTKSTAATITRKEMKAPDRFQVASGQMFEWAAAHKKPLFAVALFIALGIAVGMGLGAYRGTQGKLAGELLYKVYDAADGEISTVPLPGVQKPLFKTEEERQKAVLAAAGEVKRGFPGTPAARAATLAEADAQLKLGQADSAITAYREYLAASPKEDSFRYSALGGIAYAMESKSDLAGAAEAFDKLGAEVSWMKDRSALEKARILEKSGKSDEAKKILAAFPSDFKDSPLKPAAEERLHRLGSK